MQRPVVRSQAALALLGALLLFAVNWYVAGKLAAIEYLHQMQSIEGAFIALSRFVAENWRDLSWFPWWYAGIPAQNAYFPLLPIMTATFAGLTGSSPALGFHAVCAFLYCLGPVTLFWMALRLSRMPGPSFVAGLLYSLTSPSALLIPAIRQDLGGAWYAQRLHAMVFYGDGPFVCSLTLLPLAVICLDAALRRRLPLLYLLAAFSVAAVVLTNWIGGAVLAMAVVAYLLGMGTGSRLRRWRAAGGVGLLAYALASPLMPPSTISTIQNNAHTIGGYYPPTWLHLVYAAALGAAAGLLHLLFQKLRTPGHVRMSLYFVLAAGSVTLCAAWAGIVLLPQPVRYHLAMEMVLSLAVAFLLQPLWRRTPAPGRWVALLLILALSLSQAHNLRRYAGGLIRPIDIRATTEYKTALWFDRNMSGGRVMAPGSVSFYMNAFTDTPQLGGGAEQGTPNWENRVALYVLYTGQNAGASDGEISVLWLKAFGVRAIAVGGPASGEHYKPFLNPRKFEGLLPEVYRDGDDYIYAVPSRTGSLAHVVRQGDLVRRAPIHGLDVGQVRRYVAALEDPALPIAAMTWTSRHSARIVTELRRDQFVSVQVTYHPGWRAEVAGARRRVFGDKIGLMAIEPQCEGRCTIDLIYDGGTEMKAAKVASLAGLLVCLAWAALSRRRGGHV